MHSAVLALAAFLACAVEMVEALTIVLAVALTRGWRSVRVGILAALVVVLSVGVIVHRPLTRVPENTLKFAVGVMLTSFGTFWGSEGAGASWPGGDAAIIVLIAGYALLALAIVAWLKSRASVRE